MRLPLLLVFILCSLGVHSQYRAINLPKFDNESRFHFGAYLAYNTFNLDVRKAPSFRTNETIYSLQIETLPGFNIGMIADMHMGNNFDLRALPALCFTERYLNYTIRDLDLSEDLFQEIRSVESTFFELPILMKFKSNRIGNTRVYLLGGGRASWDFQSNIDVDENDLSVVRLKKLDYGYEVGFGFDFYFMYFKFAPEIRIYQGLRDIMAKDGTPYTTTLDKVFSQSVTVSITFEG